MSKVVGAELRQKIEQPLKFQWGGGGAEQPQTIIHGFDTQHPQTKDNRFKNSGNPKDPTTNCLFNCPILFPLPLTYFNVTNGSETWVWYDHSGFL